MKHVKDSYYFSHDSNARHDPKCSALINDFGMEGYGTYWMVIELLSEQKGYKLKKFKKLYEGLACQFNIKPDKLQSIFEALIHDYELLVEDDENIWSESLLSRMEIREAKRRAKISAGRLGGLRSGESRKRGEPDEAPLKQNEALLKQNEAPLKQNEALVEANEALLEANEALVEANEAKESKVKENKVKENKRKERKTKKYAEYVSLTEEEYKRFVEEFGENATLKMIEILNNYKGSKGREYKNDNLAIRSWVIDRYKEDRSSQPLAPYHKIRR